MLTNRWGPRNVYTEELGQGAIANVFSIEEPSRFLGVWRLIRWPYSGSWNRTSVRAAVPELEVVKSYVQNLST